MTSEPVDELPQALELPWPRVGDRGRFNLREASGAERPLADFEWLSDRYLPDRDGTLRRVNALQYVHHEPLPDGRLLAITRLVLFQAGATRIVATQVGGTWGESPGAGTLQGNKTSTLYAGDEVPLSPIVCGLRNGMQGHRASLQAPIDLGQDCQIRGMSSVRAPVRLVPDALGKAPDRVGELVRTSLPEAPVPVHVWLAQDLPYPIRFESMNGTSQEVVRLAAFQAGGEPIASAEGAVLPGPALEWQAWLPWAINDTYASRHPWTLSKAYDWMVNQSTRRDIPEFLDQHPNAFLYFARYSESVTNVHTSYMWDVAFTDGRDWIRRCAVFEQQHWARQVIYTGTPSDDVNYSAPRFDGYCIAEKPNRLMPSPPAPPAAMPTLASLSELWRVYRGPSFQARAANAWSFEVVCLDWTCGQPGIRIDVGHLSDNAYDYTNDTYNVSWNLAPVERGMRYSTLRLDENGQALVLEESSEWWSEGHGMSLAVAEDQAPAPTPKAQELSGVPPTPWTDSVAIALTGAGVAALAIGAGLWAWSAFHGAALAAFSRLQKDHAADHPVRAAILELLEANPGLHLQEIRRRLNLANGKSLHHLGKLVRVGLIATVVAPGYTCYFPKGKVHYRLMAVAPSLKTDAARRLLEALRGDDAVSPADLAARTNLNPRLVGYHLRRLQGSGLVEFASEGRRLLIRPTPLGTEALAAGPAPDSPSLPPRPTGATS